MGIDYEHKKKPCVLSPTWRSFELSIFFETQFCAASVSESKLAKPLHIQYTDSLRCLLWPGRESGLKSLLLQNSNMSTLWHFLAFFGQIAQKLTKIKITLEWGGFKNWESSMLCPIFQWCYAKKNQRFISYT